MSRLMASWVLLQRGSRGRSRECWRRCVIVTTRPKVIIIFSSLTCPITSPNNCLLFDQIARHWEQTHCSILEEKICLQEEQRRHSQPLLGRNYACWCSGGIQSRRCYLIVLSSAHSVFTFRKLSLLIKTLSSNFSYFEAHTWLVCVFPVKLKALLTSYGSHCFEGILHLAPSSFIGVLLLKL